MAFSFFESVLSAAVSAYVEKAMSKGDRTSSTDPCVKIHRFPIRDARRDLSEALFIIAPEINITKNEALGQEFARQYSTVRLPKEDDVKKLASGYKFKIENYKHTSFHIEDIFTENRSSLVYEYKEDLFFDEDQESVTFLVEGSNKLTGMVVSDGIYYYVFFANMNDSFLSLDGKYTSEEYHKKFL